MKKVSSTLLAFSLLALMGWGLVKMLDSIWDNLTIIDTTLSATIITASVTFIIAVLTVVLVKSKVTGNFDLDRKSDVCPRREFTDVIWNYQLVI